MENFVIIGGHKIYHETTQSTFWKNVKTKIWEPETLKILDRFVKPGKIFIDIGAWNGVLSLYASKLGARVESVECDPKAIDFFIANYQLNDGNIFLSTCAISDKTGVSTLESHNGDWGNSMSTIVDRHEQMGQIAVETQTLEKFARSRKINGNYIPINPKK